MNRPFSVFRCVGCGRCVFPRRLICSKCGGDSWVPVLAKDGQVEQATTRQHRTLEEKRDLVGGWNEQLPVHLASVRTSLGPVITARTPDLLDPGTPVSLSFSSGSPFAVATDGPDDSPEPQQSGHNQ